MSEATKMRKRSASGLVRGDEPVADWPSIRAWILNRDENQCRICLLHAATEVDHFAVWAADELAKGRPLAEVTWDTCVRETGLWKDAEPPTDGDDDTGVER